MKRLLFVSALLSLAACQTVPALSTDTAIVPPPVAETPTEPVVDVAEEATDATLVEADAPETPQSLRDRADALELTAGDIVAELDTLDEALMSMSGASSDLSASLETSESEEQTAEIEGAIAQIEQTITSVDLEKTSLNEQLIALYDDVAALRAQADVLEVELAERAAEEAAAAELAALEAEAAAAAEAEAAELAALEAESDATPEDTSEEPLITLVVMEDEIRSDEVSGTPEPAPSPAQRERRTMLDYSDSPLIWSLLSDQYRADDVAIMGIVSGARSYCGLPWQQGFANFIQIAAQNGFDVSEIAEEHGRFMGGARLSLQDAGYQCNANDIAQLEAIYP